MKHTLNARLFFIILSVGMALFTSACSSRRSGWQLVWQDDFETSQLDTNIWSRIPRGRSDWNNTMAPADERCFALRHGLLVLRGIVNDRHPHDSARYHTGGIWTRGKYAFHGGRIEVKARLHGATGCWPAIWCLPFDLSKYAWPDGGEIDIMERLNHDSIVYQTIHSNYTLKHGIKDNPQSGYTAPIRPAEFNVYGVDLWPDSVVLHVNGIRTFAYPRIQTDIEGQFPFDIPQHLLIDMQLGGAWVGEVDSTQLPVEMEVDWVKYYQWQ